MSKWKWIAVAVFALVTVCPSVKAQCTGQYANDPTYAMLIPKDYAAQNSNNVAVTINVSYLSSGSVVYNHKLTVGGSGNGTTAQVNYQSWNASRVDLYYSANGGSRVLWQSNVALTGSFPWDYTGQQTLQLFAVATNSSGNTTQDVDTLTITNQAPGVYWSDGLDTNFYQQITTTFGGSSMLTSCTECAGTGGLLEHCINATHTPYSTISLTNSTSGESQLLDGFQAGNMARSNESASGSASLAISVLPGDSGTISIEDKIICSMDGIVFAQTLPKPKTSPSGGSWNPSVTGELAFTKVALKVPTHCTPLLDSNGNVIGLHCDVAYYCSARSSPPDYQPTGLDTYHYTNPALVPPFWMSMAPGTALVFGRNQPGEIAIWYFPFSTLHGVLTGVGGMDPLLLDILSPAWVSDNSNQDCTKWISGIMPWYMPRW